MDCGSIAPGAPGSAVVVIPAYKPDERLLALVRDLREAGCATVLVVDDGSGESCGGIFARLEADLDCKLVRHRENRGKEDEFEGFPQCGAFHVQALPLGGASLRNGDGGV
jgi:hypothetical protein